MNQLSKDKKSLSMAAVSRVECVHGISDLTVGTINLNRTNRNYFYSRCGSVLSSSFQKCGLDISAEDAAEELRFFIDEIYPTWPEALRNAKGSTGFDGLLILFVTARACKPEMIVESGVHVGSSLNLWGKGFPNVQVIGFDINIAKVRVKPTNVRLFEGDWTSFGESYEGNGRRTIAFFDDHINCAKRLKECWERGISFAMFDDAPPLSRLFKYRYPALPSVPIILDDQLAGNEIFEWHHKASQSFLRYKHDADEAKRARKYIESAISLDMLEPEIGLRRQDKWLVKVKLDT